jgi:HNH endonuclease
VDERFRQVDGFPGYRVSREGEVRSCRGRGNSGRPTGTWFPLKPIRRRRGYLYVNLHRNGIKTARSIHHLVLEAFVGPRPPGLICCHNDGDPSNNRLENLRWDTYLSNSEDMLRHGTRLMGSRARAKLSEEQVLEIRRRKGQGVPMRALAAEFGVCLQNIHAIVYRVSWRHLA